MYPSLVLSGAGVKRNVNFPHARNVDIAPTIARLLGVELGAGGEWQSSSTRPHSLTRSSDTPRARIVVRDATEADIESIQVIYSHHVRNGLATFEELPPSVKEMLSRRASVLEAGLPYLTAEIDGMVVGYSYATTYRPRPAYRNDRGFRLCRRRAWTARHRRSALTFAD